jgi:hypothetical protein
VYWRSIGGDEVGQQMVQHLAASHDLRLRCADFDAGDDVPAVAAGRVNKLAPSARDAHDQPIGCKLAADYVHIDTIHPHGLSRTAAGARRSAGRGDAFRFRG